MVAAFARAMASGDGHRDDGQGDGEPEGSAIGQGGDLPYSNLRAQTGRMMPGMSPDERRGSPRASLDLTVEVQAETASFPARLRSLSRIGALIEVERPLAIGSPLSLRLGLPTGELDLRGQVIRVTASGLGQGHELALMLAPLPPSVLARIDLLVAERGLPTGSA